MFVPHQHCNVVKLCWQHKRGRAGGKDRSRVQGASFVPTWYMICDQNDCCVDLQQLHATPIAVCVKLCSKYYSLRTCCCADLKRAPQPHHHPYIRNVLNVRSGACASSGVAGGLWRMVCCRVTVKRYTSSLLATSVAPVTSPKSKRNYVRTFGLRGKYFGLRGNFKVQVLNRFWKSQTP